MSDFIIEDGVLKRYSGNEENVIIPDGITDIRFSAFENCSNLKSITIPNSVTFIGNYAFNGCSSLKTINISNSVKTIASEAFLNCSALEMIALPDSVAYIGDCAFKNCSSLRTINIPDLIKTIGREAFSGCTNLESINFPKSLKFIEQEDFDVCFKEIMPFTNHKITIIEKDAFKDTKWFEDYPDDFVTIGNFLYEYKGTSKNIVIPDYIKKVSKYIFRNKEINTIQIGNFKFDATKLNINELSNTLDFLLTKNFGYSGNRSIKYKFAMSNYHNDKFCNEYIKRYFFKIFSYFAAKKDIYALLELIKLDSFINKYNIDKALKISIENELTEITVTLINIKTENNWFVSADDEFKL